MKGFESYVRKFGAHGLGYFQMKEDGLKGPLIKFFTVNDLIFNILNFYIVVNIYQRLGLNCIAFHSF